MRAKAARLTELMAKAAEADDPRRRPDRECDGLV